MNKSFTKLKNCPVCNSIDIQLFFEQKRNKSEKKLFNFLKLDYYYSTWDFCKKCNHLFLNPVFSDEISKYFYENEGVYRKFSLEGQTEIEYLRAIDPTINLDYNIKTKHYIDLKKILKLYPTIKTALDFGAGWGSAYSGFTMNNLEYVGVEIDKWCLNKAKELDRNVVQPETISNKKFDLVYSHQVFEHINYLNETIGINKQYLNENGLLFINVPTYEFTILKNNSSGGIGSLNWSHYHSFSASSFKKLFNNNDLKLIDYWYGGGCINVIGSSIKSKYQEKGTKYSSYSKALKRFKYHDFFSKNIYPISKPIIKFKHSLSRFFKNMVSLL